MAIWVHQVNEYNTVSCSTNYPILFLWSHHPNINHPINGSNAKWKVSTKLCFDNPNSDIGIWSSPTSRTRAPTWSKASLAARSVLKLSTVLSSPGRRARKALATKLGESNGARTRAHLQNGIVGMEDMENGVYNVYISITYNQIHICTALLFKGSLKV